MKQISLIAILVKILIAGKCFATDYYIDPDYSGSIRNGLQAHPFRSIYEAWNVINAELDKNDVTVYFSAREANTDDDENYGNNGEPDRFFTLRRTGNDERTTFLTLDGNSEFLRVIHGKDRLYPDTDTPPIDMDLEKIRKLEENVGIRPWEIYEEFNKKYGYDYYQFVKLIRHELV